MKDFVRVAAVSPKVYLGDVKKNAEEIGKAYQRLQAKGVQIAVFPEMALTGYTIGDLVFNSQLLSGAQEALLNIARETREMVALVGLPLMNAGRLYVCASVLQNGEVKGIATKQHLSNGEGRWFRSGTEAPKNLLLAEQEIPFGLDLVFNAGNCAFAVELCEDVWTANPPSGRYAQMGAEIIFNLAVSPELPGKNARRRALLKEQSARCLAGYVYAGAGFGECTTDNVFSGFTGIYECGDECALGECFSKNGSETIYDIDVQRIKHKRQQTESFFSGMGDFGRPVPLNILPPHGEALLRDIQPLPFVPKESDLQAYCREISDIVVTGLQTRLEKAHINKLVIGVSGGLDSTLALLFCVKTMDEMNLPRTNIEGITMPGFGTGTRTKGNATRLMEALGLHVRSIDITPNLQQHFKDIGQDESNHDVTFENAQARERTQILMDIANQSGGLVIGTGDLSEEALGFCTYNGDHMSMYNVNASIPKTLMRAMVTSLAEKAFKKEAADILHDIVSTPVSPELLPGEGGEIVQKTEEILGDYALHDFFLYHMMDSGSAASRLLILARKAFENVYDEATIEKTLALFIRRFYTQQFKRSCAPDGAQAGPVSLSPRGAYTLPSDLDYQPWL